MQNVFVMKMGNLENQMVMKRMILKMEQMAFKQNLKLKIIRVIFCNKNLNADL